MVRKKTSICVLVVIIVLIGLLTFYYYNEHSIEYTLSYSYETDPPLNSHWRVVSNHGFYTEENYEKDYKSQTGNPLPENIDATNHTYIICYGFTLERLSYREIDKSGRFTSDTPYYYVKATLKTIPNTTVNVYLVNDLIAIDRDIHTNYSHDTIIIR